MIVTWGGSRISLSRIFTFQRAFFRAAVNGNVYAMGQPFFGFVVPSDAPT
jgi:hypothetical protein